jgi:hypothetical protein
MSRRRRERSLGFLCSPVFCGGDGRKKGRRRFPMSNMRGVLLSHDSGGICGRLLVFRDCVICAGVVSGIIWRARGGITTSGMHLSDVVRLGGAALGGGALLCWLRSPPTQSTLPSAFSPVTHTFPGAGNRGSVGSLHRFIRGLSRLCRTRDFRASLLLRRGGGETCRCCELMNWALYASELGELDRVRINEGR